MKKVFLLTSFFVLVFSAYLADSTIEVVSTNGGISISGTSSLRKFIRCNMTDTHTHTSSCDTNPPTGSHTERTNIPSKVTLTVSGVVSGYGAAGGAFRKAVIDEGTVADWDGDAGEQSETLSSVGTCGFAGTSPKAYTENKTVDFSVSGDSDEDLGTDHQWSATGGIYTRGIEWIGTASSSVEVGVLADLDQTPSLQVSATTTAGTLMKYQQAKDKGWSSTSSNGTWEVVALYSCSKCGGTSQSSSDWLRLSDAHSHHFICGGCGKHVKCKRSRGDHMEVSCPQENGINCSYGSYYKCSPHTHAYTGSGSGNNNGGNPPTGSTPPPSNSDIQYACNDHSGPSSGSSGHTAASCGTSGHYICDSIDHSPQASCTSMDSNGNSCTVTSFYACDSHTHSYPSPPPRPPTPIPPPPPTTVACGARGWTGCMELVSSSTTHKVPSCSGCGGTYWTCSAYASNHTDLKTCRYSECRQQWKRCASAPICNKPYRKRNGLKCWAE